VMLLGGVGVLAFLLSAILPDDDAIQQEFLHSRVSVRVVGGIPEKSRGTRRPFICQRNSGRLLSLF
jgi:hypothetical protein